MVWRAHFSKISFCLLIVIFLLGTTSCKKESTESSGSSSVVTKTYWTENRINEGFHFELAEEHLLDDHGDSVNTYEGFSAEAIEGLQTIASKWDVLLGTGSHLSFETVPNKDYADLASYQDESIGIYTSNNWYDSLGSTALAITQYFGIYRLRSNGEVWLEMRHADIIFNYHNFKFSIATTRYDGSYDLLSIALHELGHFWGLQHSPYSDTVMYASIGQTANKRNLHTRDKAAFRSIYEYAQNAGIQAAIAPKSTHLQSAPTEEEEEPSYDLGPLDDDETVYRFVVELRSDGTHVHHPPVKVEPWCVSHK
jgi:hypothetical protein